MRKKILFLFLIFFIFSLESFALKDRSLLRKLKKGTPYEKIIKDFGKPDAALPVEKGRSCPNVIVYHLEETDINLLFYIDDKLCGLQESVNNEVVDDIIPFVFEPFKNNNKKGAYKLSPAQSEKKLLENGFVRAGSFPQKTYEGFYIYKNHNNHTLKNQYAVLVEDRILYTFYFYEGEETNNYVCAYIFDENYENRDYSRVTTFVKFDKNKDGIIEDEEGGMFPAIKYKKLRPESVAPNVWVPCDANGNGVLEENEGRWGWY